MNAIADSSSLIVLARLDALWLFARICTSVVLTTAVGSESVTQGKAHGYRDANRIEAAIQAGQLQIISPTAIERRLASAWQRSAPGLSRTDCLTLACARERALTLIMEEQRARNLALAQGIAYVTIQVLPLQGFINSRLSFAECTDLLTRIGQAMHMDSAIIAVLQAAATEIQQLRSRGKGSQERATEGGEA